MDIYIVKPGDTVFEIARRYGISESRLIYDNQLGPDGNLVVGQALLIWIPEVIHRVQAGETLQMIAELYGVSLRLLYQNNSYLLERNYLVEGESLVIRYTEVSAGRQYVVGYAYPFVEQSILREALLYIDELLVFSYGFTLEGALIPPMNEEYLIDEARLFDVSPILVLTPFSADGKFNNYLVKQVVSNEQVQERLIQELLETVNRKGYRGVDVDFEYILPEDKDAYAEFVSALRNEMNMQGYQVSVALAPKTSSGQPGLLYEGMDYEKLGNAADHVFLMTYEWGYTYGPPMAVAPINKVREVLDYAVTEIPGEKILMGIPNYGYDWMLPFVKGGSGATLIGNVEAVRIAEDMGAEIQYDETAQSPYFMYLQNGVQHEVWFEDVRSIREKIMTALSYQFRGFGYWNLMRPFRANWLLVHALVQEEG